MTTANDFGCYEHNSKSFLFKYYNQNLKSKTHLASGCDFERASKIKRILIIPLQI